jgi:SPP1 family predicted phage head-tail adaptor
VNRRSKKSIATRARHRVIVKTKTCVSDGIGGQTETWSGSTEIWASIAPIKAEQKMDYKTIGVDATHLVEVRGLIDIPEDSMIYYGSRVFEVKTVENIQEADFLKIAICEEVR